MHIGRKQQRSLQRFFGQLRAAQGAVAVAVHLACCQASDCILSKSRAFLSGILEMLGWHPHYLRELCSRVVSAQKNFKGSHALLHGRSAMSTGRLIRWLLSGRPSPQSHPGIYESLAWSGLAFVQILIPGAILLAWPSFAASAKLTPRLRVRIARSSLSGSDYKADYNNVAPPMRAGRNGTSLAYQRWQTRCYLDLSSSLTLPGHPCMHSRLCSQKLLMLCVRGDLGCAT